MNVFNFLVCAKEGNVLMCLGHLSVIATLDSLSTRRHVLVKVKAVVD